VFANKTVYALNSAAVGDLLAAAPALKYAINTFHAKTPYLVGIYPDFKELFPFVPESNFTEIKTDYPSDYSVRYLNPPKTKGNVCKITPSRMKLTHYGSINLIAKVISDFDAQYVPLKPVGVARYGVDFTKSVIIIATYRDKQRSILPSEMLEIARYVHGKGLVPVYVGRTGAVSIWKNNLAVSDFEYPGFGVDLRNQTTLGELASMMAQSKAVVGMDSGPIHLAFTTQVPVVCGFTTVAPQYRIPYRGLAKTVSVVPNIFCNFCESDWNLNFWNFNNCPRKMDLAECVTKMTAARFVDGLESLGIF